LEFEDLLELARDSYLEQFATFVDKQRTLSEKGTSELKLKVPEEGGFYRNYYCADYATGGEMLELQSEEEVTFDTIEVTLGDMDMVISRLVWDDITIKAGDKAVSGDDFSEWFETWFDPEETTFDPDTRFSACIHSLRVDEAGVSVDFGTAPITALADLLMRFESLGCRSLSVS
jgi:hypothetical protein